METDTALGLIANEVLKWPHWESTGELSQCQAFAATHIAITEYTDRLYHSPFEWCLGISFEFAKHRLVLAFGLSEEHAHNGKPLLEMHLNCNGTLVATNLFRADPPSHHALISTQLFLPGPWVKIVQKIGQQIQISKVCHAEGHWPRWDTLAT